MLVVVLSLVVTLSPMAARGVRADLEAVYAAETAFNALSANNVASALSAFAPEAVALNLPRDEQYVGREEIRQMLYQLTRIGRTYDIIGLKMVGSNLELTVAMSDYDRR
jgi:ketosteroid isomerase-like protein